MKRVSAGLATAVLLFLAWWLVNSQLLRHEDKGGQTKHIAVANQAAPVPVTVVEVQQADFPVYLFGLGTVQPFHSVTLRSRVDGLITKVSFKQGQMVKQGDPLVEIDRRPYQAALDQVKAKKQVDEASLANAKRDLERYTKAGTLANTQQQIDTQSSLVAQQEAQIAIDDAAIQSAQTQLDYTNIVAPISGKIGFRLVDPGNIVHAADQTGIVTIVQLSPISVVLTAPEERIPEINAALAAGEVLVDVLTSDGLKTLAHGHLAIVDNTVSAATGTIGMKAQFQNEDHALYPGLSVSARILVNTLKQVVVVPDGVVQHGPDGLFAFVVGDDNKVSIVPIEVSNTGQGKAVVRSGLSPGQKVVADGQYRLVAGTKIQGNEKATEGH